MGTGLRTAVDLLGIYSKQMDLCNRLVRLERDVAKSAKRDRPVTPRRQSFKLARRLTDEDRASIAKSYQDGATAEAAGRPYGISKASVLKILDEAGVKRRLPRMGEAEIQEARRLYEGGLSLADVGKRLGRDASTVHKALKREGIRMRDSHGRA
jgi:DNA-directed RNA polymerase specialized sigma24 family protein